MIKRLFLMGFIILISSCSKDSSKGTFIDWEDFPVMHHLEGEKISLPDSLPPIWPVIVLRDSIGLVTFRDTEKHHGILINLKNRKLLQDILPKGRGPNELLSASILTNDYCYSRGDTLRVIGIYRKIILTHHLDSLLKHGDATNPIEQLNYKSNFGSPLGVGKLNNLDYVCYNPYYMSYGKYINENAPPLFIANNNSEQESFNERDETSIQYFTINQSRRILYTNFKHQNIVLADCYSDWIGFYDKRTLKIKKTLIGPDSRLPTIEMNPQTNQITFKKGTRRVCYDAGCQTDNFIYLVYRNQDYRQREPVSIFKIDWEGNLIACYKLETFLQAISISQDEKTLYGNITNEDYSKITLMKYDLP